MNVVAGPAPKVRDGCVIRQVLLLPWLAGAAWAGFTAGQWLVFGNELLGMGKSVPLGWFGAAIAGGGAGAALIGFPRVPRLVRGGMLEYRRRFPEQSLDAGRWMRLPFLPWKALYLAAGDGAAMLGLICGLAYGFGARSVFPTLAG